ncbi:MAG: hypothetical protein ACRDRH_08085 [Pseudonocardia sp.]
MARSEKRSGPEDLPLEAAEIFELVANDLEGTVRQTLADRSHEPARATIAALTRLDDEFSATGESPPGWTLSFLTLAGWLLAVGTAVADRPERDDEVLAWIETNLGRRYRARSRYTIGAFHGDEELASYVEALGEDFLPTLVWLLAAAVELYGDDDPGWPRRLADEARAQTAAARDARSANAPVASR